MKKVAVDATCMPESMNRTNEKAGRFRKTTPHRRLHFLLPAILLLPCPWLADAQDATVTFYTPFVTSSHLMGQFTGLEKSAPALGRIYDGERTLAQIVPNRFVTFLLPAGQHAFAAMAQVPRHPDKNHTIPLELKAGEHYFFRLTNRNKAFSIETNLEAVDCATAAKESTKSEPLDRKDVQEDVRGLLSPANALPACP
jgi:hypothetical protein